MNESERSVSEGETSGAPLPSTTGSLTRPEPDCISPVHNLSSGSVPGDASRRVSECIGFGTENGDQEGQHPGGSNVTRVYKKCASNGSLAVYVGTRTLIVEGSQLEPLRGVLVFDKDSLSKTVSPAFRIWGQITLTFRYGREDEEVLGLRFCNEAILALRQLWPPLQRDPEFPEDEEDDILTPLQTVLLERVKASSTSETIESLPFTLCGGPVGLGSFPPPPSVLLAPAKPYKGSPIGTIYDLRIYASERPEERPPRRNLIRLALRAVQMPWVTNVPYDLTGSIETRPTILSRGKIRVHCELSVNAVRYGDTLQVQVTVQNNSRSSIRGIMVSLIQQVDVCMFTSGKFKNAVGCVDDNVLIVPGASLQKRYKLVPTRGPARQWLALEEAFGRESVLAPSTCLDDMFSKGSIIPPLPPSSSQSQGPNSSRNVFAIIVSYYVKTKLVISGLSLCQNIKVPFVLLPPDNAEPDPYPRLPSPSPIPLQAPPVPPTPPHPPLAQTHQSNRVEIEATVEHHQPQPQERQQESNLSRIFERVKLSTGTTAISPKKGA